MRRRISKSARSCVPLVDEGRVVRPLHVNSLGLYLEAGVIVPDDCDGVVAGVPSGAGVVAGLFMLPDPAGWFMLPPRVVPSDFMYIDASTSKTTSATAAIA